MSGEVEKMKIKAPAPPPLPSRDDDESKLVRSAKESAAMRRLGKVLEEKKRLNSTINNHSKRLHNLSKSFRRQTLQENNRNLARAVQRGKERLRSAEAQVVTLNREKQELWDELCRLRQVVGKSDVELNTLVEDRVEKRLCEIRQAASQLMELSGTVVNLCLADRLSLTGRSSPGVDLSEVNAIARPSVGTVHAAMMSTVPVADHGLPGAPPKSGAPGAPHVSGAPDLSLIAEGSFLEPGMLPPLQFMDDSGRRLSAVSESEEERRSRSRGSTKSRRSGLIARPSLDEPRSRSRSSRNGALGIAENAEKAVVLEVDRVDNEMSGKNEMRNETVVIVDQSRNLKNGPRKSLSKGVPSISIENVEDSQCDISASEILKQRFPGGDKIARTPPRNSRSNPGSKNATPLSGSNTPKHDAFVIPLNSPSSAPKVVPTFTPTRKSADSPKILKKSTNETFSFIPLDDDKSKSDKSKSQTSRVVKVKKDLKAKKVAKTKPEVVKAEPEVEKAEAEVEPSVEPSRTRTRRRTYSMEKAENIEDLKESDAKPDLNGTFEKEKPDVLSSDVVAMETTDDEAMEAVAKEAESVVAAMTIPQVVEENLDDSLGVLDSTVLDALDMELTEVIPHSIRLNESDKVDPSADEPKNAEAPDELQVPKADKGLKRPRQISPQDPSKKVVPEKQRKRNPSQRGKKVDPESDHDQKPSSQDSDDVIMKDEEKPKKPVKSRTKTKAKEEKVPKVKESQAKEVEELDSSSSSADESAATFHYFRSKPGKLNFVVGRKDEKGRPLDPVAMMKKSRSKKKVVPNDKKTEENSSENAEEKCPYEWSGQEPESPGIDDFRKQRSGSESDKPGPKPEAEDVKEAEKPVFKIPVARSRTKSKKGPTKAETQEESAKPRSRRTTTVIKSYKEPSDEDSPSRGKKVVPSEIVPRDDKRRQTKIIRRVSAIHKPDPINDDINDVDDVSVHVINDTIVTNDVTMGDDAHESSSFRKETKTYASSRRETQVIRPKHTPDVRRQTEVLTKTEIKQALPSEEVTLPEPEAMPFDAAEPEPEPQEPEAQEVVDEEMTLDLTKLIKSVNREKAARALPPEPVDDEMTLDLTKLLKHIDRDKMIRDAQPHVTSSKPPPTSSMTSRESQPSLTESEAKSQTEAMQKTKSSKIARRKDSSRRSIRGSIDSPETLAPAMATPQAPPHATGGRLSSEVDSPDLHKLADDLMVDDVTSGARRSRSSQKARGESSRDSHVLQSRDQNTQQPTTTKKSSRKGKKDRESKSESKARRALGRESEIARARESVDTEHVGSDEEYQTAAENQEPDFEKRLSESPKRRRRGQVKSYKEPSLNVKMRRDGSTPDGKKIRKKQSRGSGKGAT